ncbi:hypothetical protein NLJ89_g3537 [Agrocybe chaxingu]|uniref:DUF7330 domain-containing protein n=1 Tax=Agrocybe chaxingu TaxID=84603 RepID=A0A9W8MYG0_9AGAR|nr:hypothetical protein NLJ89_g3537 [Agrocybe chaxingu]
MILTDDKQLEALEARRVAEEQEQEPLPTYASLQASSSAVPAAKAVNFIAISRHHSSVRETLVIDASLFVPSFLRPPLSPGETVGMQNNVKLESTHGHVYADITLVGNRKNARAVMHMKSTHGGITAKIHGPPTRSAFVLHSQALNGEVRLHIPRNFQGPLIISHRHGSVRFSDNINCELTTFGEVDSTRRCFLGDFSRWSDAPGRWIGDELVVEVKHGDVTIHYDDDVLGAPVKTRPSTLLNRIFGL